MSAAPNTSFDSSTLAHRAHLVSGCQQRLRAQHRGVVSDIVEDVSDAIELARRDLPGELVRVAGSIDVIGEARQALPSAQDPGGGTMTSRTAAHRGRPIQSTQPSTSRLGYPVVHITETNGKGSTARLIASALGEHGLRVATGDWRRRTCPNLDHRSPITDR